MGPEERLWARVEIGDCWVWLGNLGLGGRYGGIKVNGKTIPVHRFVWALLVGPIPAGLELDHLCRNTRCVNPDHLEPVTHTENLRRGVQALRARCSRGHPDSARRHPQGSNRCQECVRENNRAYRRRRAA